QLDCPWRRTTASGSKSPGFAVQVVRERPFTRADDESGSRPGGAGEIRGLGEMSAGDGVRAPEAVFEEVGAWGELHAPSRTTSPIAAAIRWSGTALAIDPVVPDAVEAHVREVGQPVVLRADGDARDELTRDGAHHVDGRVVAA